jgi:hypothetical protein
VVHASNVGVVGVPADELEGGKGLYGIDTVAASLSTRKIIQSIPRGRDHSAPGFRGPNKKADGGTPEGCFERA